MGTLYNPELLRVEFCGVEFENPFVLAAAPPSDEVEMVERAFEAGWAGAVLKTTSVPEEEVNLAYPMMSGWDFGGGKLVGMGNIDLISQHHVDEIEKRVARLKERFPEKVVITSIMGASREEWQTLVRRLEAAGADMIECSFSCPQGMLGSKPGFMLGQDPVLVEKVARWIKEAASRIPVVIKITPQVTDIVEVAEAVKRSGADAICASNSIPSLMGVDVDTFTPVPDVGGVSTYSGYSGPAIKPLTLRTIAEIAKHVDIPITGTGGPTTWKDAVEFIALGCTTVQFCTAVMHYGYRIIDDLKEGLALYMEEKGFGSVEEFRGRALDKIVTHDELRRDFVVRASIRAEKCVECGGCYVACRDGGHMAIERRRPDADDNVPAVDEDKCVGCGLCARICPVGAVTLEYRRK